MTKEWEYKAKSIQKQELLKSFESWTRNDLIECILDLRKQVSDLDLTANAIETKKQMLPTFDKSWSVPTKIVYILKKENKVLLSAEIFKELVKLDKSFLDFNLPKTVLSNYLSRSSKSKRIAKIKVAGIKTHYFGLPEWLDSKKEVMPPYKNALEKF